MPIQFPEVVCQSWTADNYKLCRQAIDSSVNNYINDKRSKRRRFNYNYNAYNGLVEDKAFTYITSTYGRLSKTKYIRYKLGRSKLEELYGEFLGLELNGTIITTNQEAINAKIDEAASTLGFIKSKEQIEQVRKQGLNIFPDVQIPDVDEDAVWDSLNLKSKNEIVMQHIVTEKINSQYLKRKFADNFKDLLINSECFGKIEKDLNGCDTYRLINPKDAMYLDSLYDPFLERTPFIGERKKMYKHEILSTFTDLTKDQKKLIDSYCNFPTDYFGADEYEFVGSAIVIPVYFVEWKVVDAVYVKISPAKDSEEPYIREISQEFYDSHKKSIDNDVKNGKYKLEVTYKENIWEGVRIGKDIYTQMRQKPYTMQSRLGGRRFVALYDYVGLLFNRINGTSISLQEMMTDLEQTFDILMFQIRREISKIKGKVLLYDRMGLPKNETVNSVLYRISEDGLIDYSSGSASGIYGNVSDEKLNDLANSIKEIDLGASQSLGVLISLKQDIERSIDRITGINSARQGFAPASTTATGVNSAIEASNSITYGLFYFINEYCNRVIMKLAEKTKINWEWIESHGKLLFSDKERIFMEATLDLTNDDYSFYISDGRKYEEIKQRMRGFYAPQINAGELRASDIVKAESKQTFVEYQEVLHNAWKEIKDIAQKQNMEKSQQEQENLKLKLDIAREDREDRQQHEKDLIILQGEVDKEKDLNKGKMRAATKTLDSKNKTLMKEQEVADELKQIQPIT